MNFALPDLHPALSGFPPVILCLLIISELYSIRSKRPAEPVQTFLLTVLAAVLPFTYFSGWWAADAASSVSKVPGEVIALHQLTAKAFAFSLVIPILSFALMRGSTDEIVRARLKLLFRAGLALSLVLAVLTGYRGGQLVFGHGAGVHPKPLSTEQLPETAQ